MDHLDSVSQARDLDALPAALGEEKLNVYALSYGTVLGEMYAEQFPDRIRTMILDGVVDHSADTTRIEVTGSKAAQESFEKFVDWCAESAACALHGKDVRAIVADLYARADAGTLPDPTDPSTMLSRVRLTQRILEPLGNGVVTGVADRIVELTTSKPGPAPEATPPAATVPLPIYISCADHHSDIDSYAKLTAVNAMAETVAPDVKHGWHGVASLCVNPPFETTNPPHELDVDGAPPIMVSNSRYDDSTPHANAVRVADQIDGAVLVTYDGIGHGAAPRGPCMAEVVTAYYLAATPPAPDTHCPAEPLP